ncbi:phasin family protein [Polynucleobacter sp. AP-Titi-500A-B4]|uniref:phasin family protein n=1 Tax=Polynucleobacter sp. AP-Titi-500A-B4 TaxID=2576923 RepID=UPI001BFD4ED7|nr:phasin family protein [Polynucleobacter sp. AP-Titi-500A-B4]QWE13379.1 phasin family protein [Polynucleobacter sp. AP-Titi-500A-B4]
MFQNQLNDQIAQAQAKAVENAKHLAQVAVESAQELAEINQAAAKDALSAAQDASSQLLAIKDPQQLAKLAQPETAQEAAKYAAAYQAKVSKVVRNGNKEVAQVVDASIDDARDDLVKFVKEATKTVPAGSEAFVSAFKTAFDASLQQFDQVRATATDAFANFEKSVDAALANIQSQYAVAKPAAKARKAA